MKENKQKDLQGVVYAARMREKEGSKNVIGWKSVCGVASVFAYVMSLCKCVKYWRRKILQSLINGEPMRRTTYRSFGYMQTYGLQHAPGSIGHWDAHKHENVFRNLEITVLDNVHHCREVWALFNNKSDVARVILRKQELLVRVRLADNCIPFHDQARIEWEMMDTWRRWTTLKEILQGLVVEAMHATKTQRYLN